MQRAQGLPVGLGGENCSLSENQTDVGLKLVKSSDWGTQWYHFYKHTFLRLETTISVALASASDVFKQLISLVLNERFPSGCTFTAVFQCEGKAV